MTFFSEASANSSTIARFKTRQPQTVTSSATATASSEISLDDAYQKAYELAQNIANSQAQHDANNLVQSVDTATIGEKIIYLGSSLLKDHIREEEDNKTHTLLKDFTLPDGMHFHIQHGKKLHILENAHLTINKNNEAHIYGTAISHGKITVNGGKLVNHSSNTLTLSGPGYNTPNIIDNDISSELSVTGGATLINSASGIITITSNATVFIGNNSTFINESYCTCNIMDGAIFTDTTSNIITNFGTINLYDTSPTTATLGCTDNSSLTNNGTINVGLGNTSSSGSEYSGAGILFIPTNTINSGVININYNNNSTPPNSNSNPATSFIKFVGDTINNPNVVGKGSIIDYVSTTTKNGMSLLESVFANQNALTVPYNGTSNPNFPSFITVVVSNTTNT
jgi:hypothetical protein